MNKLSLIVLFIVVGCISTASLAEDSIPVVPGQYSVKSTTTSNLNPEPKTQTEEHCIPIDKFTPSMALPDATCTASNIKKSSNVLTFDIKCPGNDQRPPMTSKAEVVTTKSTLNIKMDIVNTFEDKVYSVKSLSEGKRIGECKQ
ncbi:MAG: hypothetical protein DHS20C13_01630 [Thermodesulfobacteriota bacterium]|nr:MAG: hypothetical protein DHS20C13_01630 [Thermodesulfobacteriota bacterium]